MVMKYAFSGLLLCMLTGCSAPPPQPAQKAQKARITPQATLNMAQLCKDNAAVRYSTGARQIDVSHFEQFRGSYELSGKTARNERFICSFDPDGQFLHLSMR
ncbi:MAG: YsaB family lipoprotein [Klebsiella grimontii]|nr:YsaB family lipoprotein [Klebsiella grimontii]